MLKEIPGTQGFLASDTGEIYGPNGDVRNTYRNGDGYITACVITTDGSFVTFGVQRLVALAHIPCDENPSKMTVNHIDHDITNNYVSNLEWVTCEINNIHASLMRTNNTRPCIIGTKPSGEKILLLNMVEASEVIDATIQDVWNAIKNKTSINGWYLEHLGSKDPIPIELHKPKMVNRGNGIAIPEKPIKIKDLDRDGGVTFFISLSEAARQYHTSASHIHQCMYRGNGLRLFRKRYLVVYANESFPELSVEEINEALCRGSKDVVAYNTMEKKLYLYPSASSFIQAFNLSKKAVTTRLRAGNISDVSGWLFTYKTSESVDKLKKIIESPVS